MSTSLLSLLFFILFFGVGWKSEARVYCLSVFPAAHINWSLKCDSEGEQGTRPKTTHHRVIDSAMTACDCVCFCFHILWTQMCCYGQGDGAECSYLHWSYRKCSHDWGENFFFKMQDSCVSHSVRERQFILRIYVLIGEPFSTTSPSFQFTVEFLTFVGFHF